MKQSILIIFFLLGAFVLKSQCPLSTYSSWYQSEIEPISSYNITADNAEKLLPEVESKISTVKSIHIFLSNNFSIAKITELLPLMNNLEVLEIKKSVDYTDTAAQSNFFDASSGLSKLTALKLEFDSYPNSMNTSGDDNISNSILKFSTLKTLYVRSAYMKELTFIGKMSSLENIYLETPNLKYVPSLVALKKLKNLMMKSDQLISIPDCSSADLDGIYISGNFDQLKDLSGDWINSTAIDTFSISGNNLNNIKFSSAKKGPEFICIKAENSNKPTSIDFSDVELPALKELNIFVNGKISYINFNHCNAPLLLNLELFCDGLLQIEKCDSDTKLNLAQLTLFDAENLRSIGLLGMMSVKNLSIYDLSPDSFKNVIDELVQYKQLDKLTLSPSTLEDCPSALKKLKGLKELVIKSSPVRNDKSSLSDSQKKKLQKMLPQTKITFN